jgi:hypothetical protein
MLDYYHVDISLISCDNLAEDKRKFHIKKSERFALEKGEVFGKRGRL